MNPFRKRPQVQFPQRPDGGAVSLWLFEWSNRQIIPFRKSRKQPLPAKKKGKRKFWLYCGAWYCRLLHFVATFFFFLEQGAFKQPYRRRQLEQQTFLFVSSLRQLQRCLWEISSAGIFFPRRHPLGEYLIMSLYVECVTNLLPFSPSLHYLN